MLTKSLRVRDIDSKITLGNSLNPNFMNKSTPYFVWMIHENMSPCTGSRVNSYYEWIDSWFRAQFCLNMSLRISETPSTAHCCIQCPNHWAMTYPTETDWHQLNSITWWTLQRFDSEQEWFLVIEQFLVSVVVAILDLIQIGVFLNKFNLSPTLKSFQYNQSGLW